MATNVEFKARVQNPTEIRELVEGLSDRPCEVIRQEDTFFYVSKGRLKLRVLAPDYGQLIHYERENSLGPKRSNYVISTTSDPDSLKVVLQACLGIRGTVRKQRLLYRVGGARIHLDEVEGLGAFVEVEAILSPGQSVEQGEARVTELMTRLGVEKTDLIDVAYIDLLEHRAT
jgi:predicted adenylyl cyclase CyaB